MSAFCISNDQYEALINQSVKGVRVSPVHSKAGGVKKNKQAVRIYTKDSMSIAPENRMAMDSLPIELMTAEQLLRFQSKRSRAAYADRIQQKNVEMHYDVDMERIAKALESMNELRKSGLFLIAIGVLLLVPFNHIAWVPWFFPAFPMLCGAGLLFTSWLGRHEAASYKKR